MSAVFTSASHAVGRWAPARPLQAWAGRVRELRAKRPPLAGGERVCWRGRSGAGQLLVASQRALYLREAASQAAAWSRLGWEQVAAVEWSRLTGVLQLPVWPDLDASPVLVSLGHRSRLPAFASEQMAASRLLVQRVAVCGGRGATVVARRPPGTEAVSWLIQLDPRRHPDDPDDPDDQALRAAVTETLPALRAYCGF